MPLAEPVIEPPHLKEIEVRVCAIYSETTIEPVAGWVAVQHDQLDGTPEEGSWD